MATIRKGILGGFSGKVGPVVGSTWRGKDVMRSLPKKGNRIATAEQLEQRAKFGLMTRFLAPLSGKLSVYYGQPSEDKSRMNLATSYHIREAITGIYPDYTVDYPKVILTKGELLGLESAAAVAQAGAIMTITWEDNAGQSQAKADDVLFSVFYNQTKGLLEWQQSAIRSAATATVNLPNHWTGDTVHCWASFASADDKLVANSRYLGGLTLL
ncbi:MAG: DUF6266 family protein [Flavobacterium sp.]|nr:DUF6266 family protein [Flavobacterium sp.]